MRTGLTLEAELFARNESSEYSLAFLFTVRLHYDTGVIWKFPRPLKAAHTVGLAGLRGDAEDFSNGRSWL